MCRKYRHAGFKVAVFPDKGKGQKESRVNKQSFEKQIERDVEPLVLQPAMA
jgi:hypothetical protein